jgi:hypothetical protein
MPTMLPRRGVGLVTAVWITVGLIVLPAVQDAAPIRVVDRVEGRQITLDDLVTQMAVADVLLVGGTRGDAATHRAEARLIDALAAKHSDITLALEVFDRQAQEPFDHFQMGHLTEVEFLADVERPWPSYARDYKEIVDAAIVREWSIVAAAPPRPIVEAVAAGGLDVLETLPAAARAQVAASHACAGIHHPGARHLPGPHSNVAFCLESETIAESVAQAHAAGAIGGRRSLVIALVQSFRLGHLTRLTGDVLGRLPGRTVASIFIASVPDVQAVPLAPNDLAIPRIGVYVQP